MASLKFTYDYPYIGYGSKGLYRYTQALGQYTLNDCYTTPMFFNSVPQHVKHITVDLEVENTGVGYVTNIAWEFFVKVQRDQWIPVDYFIMPTSGKYTVDVDILDYAVVAFAAVPARDPGYRTSWNIRYDVTKLTITENLPEQALGTGRFLYGVFYKQYSVTQRLNEVFVNVDGVLHPPTDILVNIGGTLKSVPPVWSAFFKTEEESVAIVPFTSEVDGVYRICQKYATGDHELRLYSKEFTPLYDGYFYDKSFPLKAGDTVLITVTHYYRSEESESYLAIYKEE